jgi:hypothetical protein
MRVPSVAWRAPLVTALLAVSVTAGASLGAPAHPEPSSAPTPGVACDKGSMPEKTQGRAPAADYTSGRAAKGYYCNAREVSHFGKSGGYRVERYVDAAGHECAFFDSTLLWPTSFYNQGTDGPGVYVMDMSSSQHPVLTDVLRTPAMQSPHESLRLNVKRGLLVADMGYPTFMPGFVDVYDVSKDCRHPALDASAPIGVLGHEGGFSPDGKTFWVASLEGHTLAAIDLTTPTLPKLIWATQDYQPHGISLSDDGNTLYMAEKQYNGGSFKGLVILDVSQVQKRVTPLPTVTEISQLNWKLVSTPQNATPFTRNGHRYVLETDEFGGGSGPVGAARIIDVQDPKKPFVVSNLRLAIDNVLAQTPDPGDDQQFQGYEGHYCTLPSRVDPNIVACTFIMSGLRVFDIRNPAHPREVAYFNKPLLPGADGDPLKAGSFAMSAPAYDDQTHDIWYTDGNTGFYVVKLSKSTGITTFAKRVVLPGN